MARHKTLTGLGYDPALFLEREAVLGAISTDYQGVVDPLAVVCIDDPETRRMEQGITFGSDGVLGYHVVDATYIPAEGKLTAYAERHPYLEDRAMGGKRYSIFGDPKLGEHYHMGSERLDVLPAVSFLFDDNLELQWIERSWVSPSHQIARSRTVSSALDEVGADFDGVERIATTTGELDAVLSSAVAQECAKLFDDKKVPKMPGARGYEATHVSAPLRIFPDFKNLHNLSGMLWGDGVRFFPDDPNRETARRYEATVRALGLGGLGLVNISRDEFSQLVDFAMETTDEVRQNMVGLFIDKGIWGQDPETGSVTVKLEDAREQDMQLGICEAEDIIVTLLQRCMKYSTQEITAAKINGLLKTEAHRQNVFPKEVRRLGQSFGARFTFRKPAKD